jgi:uracil-DNA glycosylase family 4
MPERYHPLARCEDCDLRTARTFVPSYIPEEPNGIAVVGEAPGLQEARKGIPFTGPSGKLLNRVLSHYGIERRDTLLTNACLCRPVENATPSKRAIECCRARLLSELGGSEKILALGNTAAQVILNTGTGITSLRIGPARSTSLLPGAEVVPTFHPAFCLRNGDAFPSLVNDASKLVRTMQPWAPPQYLVVDDEETTLLALAELDGRTDRVVVDIECGIEKDADGGQHPNNFQMLCIGICYARGKVLVIGENAYQFSTVQQLLTNILRRKKVICQNGKFDLSGIYPTLGDVRLWFDTMLAHYCLDERPEHHGLKVMGVELLGTPQWEHEIQKYLGAGRNYAVIPRPLLYKYNAYDCAVTWDLAEYFEVELEREAATFPSFRHDLLGKTARELHDFLVAAANELKFLELNGVHIDKVYSLELEAQFLESIADRREKLNALLDNRVYDKAGGINPNSPKQLKEFFADNNVRTASTDVDHLEMILTRFKPEHNMHKFITLLMQNRKDVKKYGTYVKGIRERTYRGRVYTTYSLHGTTSGRLASKNPNLQNIDRDKAIRKQFNVSKPTNVFVHGDYAQAEGRIICTLARDEYLRSVFADPNADLFTTLGKKLYAGITLNKDQRVRVKAYFYGLSYGREAYSIATEYGWSVRETERDIEGFMDLIPDVRNWQRQVKKLVLAGEDLQTTFGRKRRFALITDENRKDVLNEALSFLPQSTASDICLSALVRLRPMLRGKGHLRLTIHDALVAECDERYRDEVADLIRQVMVEEGAKWTDYVPFKVDISYGKHWGEL